MRTAGPALLPTAPRALPASQVGWWLLWLAVLTVGWGRGLVPLFELWRVDADGLSPLNNNLPQWDYVNLWAGGKLAALGEVPVLFDHAAFNAWLRATFGSRIENHDWSYPPSLLLIGVPLAQLPLVSSYLAWTAGTLAALGATLWRNRMPLAVCALTLASPAVLNNITFGQNGALTAALLLGGFLMLDRRPLLAGVLLGLLSFKPHLLILVPVCLVAARRWPTLIAAAATAAAVAIATTLSFGWEAWRLFLSETQPLMRGILEAPYEQAYQMNAVTVFMLARALGGSVAIAYAAQIAAGLAAAALAWRVWRMPDAEPNARIALTVSLGLLATPYAWSYDMVAFAAVTTMLIAGNGWRLTPVTALAWLWPGLAQTVTRGFLPVTPLIVIALAWAAWRALRPKLHTGDTKREALSRLVRM